MSLFEKPSAAQAAEAKTGTPETQTVASKEGANESQQVNTAEKSYSKDELRTVAESIVKERLAKQAQKHQKELDALKAQYEKPASKPSANIEEEFRTKTAAYETEKTALLEKVNAYRQNGLKATLVSKLAERNAVDAAEVTELILARKLVALGDEDEIVLNDTLAGNLDEFLDEFLSKRAYLVKASSNGGVGSKGPASPAAKDADPFAALGIPKPATSKKLWGK